MNLLRIGLPWITLEWRPIHPLLNTPFRRTHPPLNTNFVTHPRTLEHESSVHSSGGHDFSGPPILLSDTSLMGHPISHLTTPYWSTHSVIGQDLIGPPNRAVWGSWRGPLLNTTLSVVIFSLISPLWLREMSGVILAIIECKIVNT